MLTMKTNTMIHTLVIAAASLALVLTPSVGLANTPARTLPHQTQVVRKPARKNAYFHTPAAKTEGPTRSIEQVIEDQRDWYQMRS
jgi:hypothetical protein